MKKSNNLFKLIAVAIISLTSSSCMNEFNNLFNSEQQQNENFAAEREKSEITTVSNGSLIIYKPVREIKLDPKFADLGQPESIREAYNKPGKPVIFKNVSSADYLAKSLWTKYNYTKEIIMVHYNKSKNGSQPGFIFKQNITEIKETMDIVPIIIFLGLLLVSIHSMFCKSDTETILIFGLIVLGDILAYDILIKFLDSTFLLLILLIPLSFAVSGIFVVFSILLKMFGEKKITMPSRKEKVLSDILSFSLISATFFLIFAKLSIYYLPWPFLFFLSPYLVFWIIRAVKTSQTWKLNKITRRAE